jgi:hypothetical protein
MNVSILAEIHAVREVARTIDRSTAQEMPDYSEPTFSSGGYPGELSASYARAYEQAHRDEELDELRNLAASTELSPDEFRAIVRHECPGRRWKVQVWNYCYSDDYPASMNNAQHHATVYRGPDDKDGFPLKADSLRDLARLMREAHEHMARMGTVNLVAVS